MGREGVAFSFVTPEEGPELTRIEQRINTLLQRDEIAGFDTSAPVAKEEEDEQPPPPAPSDLSSRRPPKRYRRAL